MDIKTSMPSMATRLLEQANRGAAARPAAGGATSGATPGATFSGALDQALKSVSAQQNEASRLSDAFIADPSSASLEQTMVSMQKAQIGFQSALHVRNRLVSAYTDIMNMQV